MNANGGNIYERRNKTGGEKIYHLHKFNEFKNLNEYEYYYVLSTTVHPGNPTPFHSKIYFSRIFGTFAHLPLKGR